MKGSVKKDDKSWYYVVDVGTNGKRQQQKRRFKTKKEAEKALAEVVYSLNIGTFVKETKVLYKDYLREWFSTKEKCIGIQTAKVYRNYLNGRIIPVLGDAPISKLNIIQIQSFINKLSEEALSSATIKKIYEIIRNSLEHAVDFEILPKNPALKVKLPKSSKKEMRVWSELEVNKFLQVSKEDPMYIVFYLALTTGMRQGEILGLRFQDIEFDKHYIKVMQTLSHDGKTIISGAKTKTSLRKITISESVIKVLRGRKLDVTKSKLGLGPVYQDFDLIACTQYGTPLNPANVRRSFNRLIGAADIPNIRFHDLRHTHATMLLSKGVNVKVISERLGHSNIKVTLDTYSHILPTMQEELVRKLDEIIG